MVLKRIREERKDAAQDKVAGRAWSELTDAELPACLTERGAALNAKAYSISSRHPFAELSAKTHGHFATNSFRLPPYSVQTIPFRWTRKDDAQAIADRFALPFDIAREPQLGFKSPWLNDFKNQQIMLGTFFSALQSEKSLIFLYAKRTPLADDPRRVLVGVGRITSVGPAQEHAYSGDTRGKLRGLMWERAISHSIRPEGLDGFVLPYQQLLALAELDGTIDPSQFVAFAPDEGFDAFSNVAEHVDHDLAIASLLSLADKVRVIARHIPGDGIVTSSGLPNALPSSGNSVARSRGLAALFTPSRSDTGHFSRWILLSNTASKDSGRKTHGRWWRVHWKSRARSYPRQSLHKFRNSMANGSLRSRKSASSPEAALEVQLHGRPS